MKLEKADFMNKKNSANYDIIKNDNNKYTSGKKLGFNRRSSSTGEEIKPHVDSMVEDKHNPKNKKMLSMVSEMDEFYRDGKFKINPKEKKTLDFTENKRNIKPVISARSSSAINNSRMEKIYEQSSSLFNKDFYDTNMNSNYYFLYLYFFS